MADNLALTPDTFNLRACPQCESDEVIFTGETSAFGVCLSCRTIFVAYPDNWCRDPFQAEPCDDCAFRPGSPEQQDPERWAARMSRLKSDTLFYCHKGMPVDVDIAEQRTDYRADLPPEHRRRLCAGYARMIAAQIGKGMRKATEEVCHG